jgi:5-methylthioadenosine/S-adenosylhomocysteine deaminase
MTSPHDENGPCDCCGEPVTPRVSRRSMLFGAAGAGLMGAVAPALMVPAQARAQETSTQYKGMPERGEFVIRGGSLLTVDDTLGDIANGDIHVKDGVIIAIGTALEVPEGVEEIDASRMIVMPGMVETHWHAWTSSIRNLLAKDFEYFALKRSVVPHMTPEDFYAGDMLAMAEALNAGITGIHNYCHHVVSGDTVEAEMRAHQDSGIRALYTFGHKDGLDAETLIDLPLAGEIHQNWFEKDAFEGRTLFGLNSRGPASLSENIFRQELDWAFERDLTVAMHAGQSRYNYSVVPLKEWGYLGPKTLLVHYVHAKPEDRAAMAETGAPLSYSVHSEFRLGTAGYQQQQLVHMANQGVLVSLSFDTNTLAPIDMFEAMSTAWYMGVPFAGTDTEDLEALDFRQVIAMGTINGAKALGFGDKAGSLTVGKRADITLIRADDLNVTPAGFIDGTVARTARASNVDTVIADGRIMKRSGKLIGLDVDKIKENAVRSAHDLRVRAGETIAPSSDTVPSF